MITRPTSGEPSPERARFCPACGTPLPERGAGSGEERKVVTVVFAELVSGADRLGAEPIAAEVHVLVEGAAAP